MVRSLETIDLELKTQWVMKVQTIPTPSFSRWTWLLYLWFWIVGNMSSLIYDLYPKNMITWETFPAACLCNHKPCSPLLWNTHKPYLIREKSFRSTCVRIAPKSLGLRGAPLQKKENVSQLSWELKPARDSSHQGERWLGSRGTSWQAWATWAQWDPCNKVSLWVRFEQACKDRPES